MKMRTLLGIALCSVLVAGPVVADPAADAEHQKMMESYMAAASPGPVHQHLATMAGSWDTVVMSWMDPAAPPTESKGACEMTMVLGGRYLHQTFKGDMMGMPYEGMGYTGYDNVQKKFVSVWIDNMSTGMMTSIGAEDPATKKLTMKGTMWDAMTGAPTEFDQVLTMVDANHHTFEMWSPGPDGKKYKSMEIHYSRKM